MIIENMKFAYLIIGELRLIKENIKSLYDHLFDYYDADIFILVQKVSINDYEDIKMFDKRVVYSKIYEKPDPIFFFRDESLLKYKNDNWNKDSCLQYYINMFEMGKIIKKYKDKYDYFIIHRIDINILFPFPEKSLLEKQINPINYTFDPDFSRYYGGYGTCFFVYKKYIVDYLYAPFDVIMNKKLLHEFLNRKIRLNQENFLNYSYDKKKITIGKIKDICSYFTGKTVNDRTTFSIFKFHQKYNVICKYEKQCSEVYKNLIKWKKGLRWDLINNTIFLK